MTSTVTAFFTAISVTEWTKVHKALRSKTKGQVSSVKEELTRLWLSLSLPLRCSGMRAPLTLQRKPIQPQRPAIKRLELRQSQVGDVLPHVGIHRVSRGHRACVTAFGRVDVLVVPYHEVVVFGQTD